MFVYCEHKHKHVILKARTKLKTSRNYGRLSKISKNKAGFIKGDLVRGIKSFKKKVSVDRIYDAIKTGNTAVVMQTIPWNSLQSDLQEALGKLSTVAEKSYDYTLDSLPAPMQNELRLDTANPQLVSYIGDRSEQLVDNITYEGQGVIERAVNESFDKALTPRQVAENVRDHIGLNERQSRALENYQGRLEERIRNPYTPERIDKMVSSYRERLLDQRATTIARSETRSAANYGQLSVWKDAVSKGLVDKQTAKKVWIVDGDPCEICEPMDGVAIDLDDSWDLNNGDSVDIPSDAHPNCFCGMELEYEGIGESEEEEETESDDEGEE